MLSASAARFNGNDQCQRFAVGVLLKRNLLLDAIIGNREVLGSKCEDKLSGLGSYQGWNQNDGRARSEDGVGRRVRRRGLRQRLASTRAR
jgi:hypothetical protein